MIKGSIMDEDDFVATLVVNTPIYKSWCCFLIILGGLLNTGSYPSASFFKLLSFMDPTVDLESFNSLALPVHILLQHEQLVPVPWPGLELGPEHEIVLQAVPAVGPSLLDAMLDDQVEGTGMAAVPTSWVSRTHSTNKINFLDLFYH